MVKADGIYFFGFEVRSWFVSVTRLLGVPQDYSVLDLYVIIRSVHEGIEEILHKGVQGTFTFGFFLRLFGLDKGSDTTGTAWLKVERSDEVHNYAFVESRSM